MYLTCLSYLSALSSASLLRLGEGSFPTFSPLSDQIFFIKLDDLVYQI